MSLKNIWKHHSSVILTFAFAFAMLLAVSIFYPGYGSLKNLQILEALAGILGVTALGQTFVILTGGMDLSIPWMMTIAAFMVRGLTGGENIRLIYAVPIIILTGIVMGTFNGVGVAFIGIAPVIMTMATNIIYQGLLVGITNGTPGGAPPMILQNMSLSNTLGFSTLFLIWIILSVVAIFVFNKTGYGRKLYAVGSSPRITRFSGINEKLVITSAYALSGMLAAIAGIIFAGRLGQIYLGMGDDYQMQSISAVAIGGIVLTGGSGNYMGTIAGVFILIILNGVLSAINLPVSIRNIIYGVVLFVAVLIASRGKQHTD